MLGQWKAPLAPLKSTTDIDRDYNVFSHFVWNASVHDPYDDVGDSRIHDEQIQQVDLLMTYIVRKYLAVSQ